MAITNVTAESALASGYSVDWEPFSAGAAVIAYSAIDTLADENTRVLAA